MEECGACRADVTKVTEQASDSSIQPGLTGFASIPFVPRGSLLAKCVGLSVAQCCSTKSNSRDWLRQTLFVSQPSPPRREDDGPDARMRASADEYV